MSYLTRRHLLAAGAAGIAATGDFGRAAAATRQAAASAAAIDGNPPVYRARLGAAHLAIVSDGTIGFPPTTLLPDVPEEELEGFLDERHQPTDWLAIQLNAMVADIGGRLPLCSATGANAAAPGAPLGRAIDTPPVLSFA